MPIPSLVLTHVLCTVRACSRFTHMHIVWYYVHTMHTLLLCIAIMHNIHTLAITTTRVL